MVLFNAAKIAASRKWLQSCLIIREDDISDWLVRIFFRGMLWSASISKKWGISLMHHTADIIKARLQTTLETNRDAGTIVMIVDLRSIFFLHIRPMPQNGMTMFVITVECHNFVLRFKVWIFTIVLRFHQLETSSQSDNEIIPRRYIYRLMQLANKFAIAFIWVIIKVTLYKLHMWFLNASLVTVADGTNFAAVLFCRDSQLMEELSPLWYVCITTLF